MSGEHHTRCEFGGVANAPSLLLLCLNCFSIPFGSGEEEREGCAKFGPGEEATGKESGGLCVVVSALQQKQSGRSCLELNLIMDITQVVLARLRRDERHELRGGDWSLW